MQQTRSLGSWILWFFIGSPSSILEPRPEGKSVVSEPDLSPHLKSDPSAKRIAFRTHCWICSPIRLQNWHAITTYWHSMRTLDLVICQNLWTFFCVVVKIQKDFEKQLKHLADTQLGNWATLNWTVKFDSLIHKDLRDNCILTVQNGRPRDRLRKGSSKTSVHVQIARWRLNKQNRAMDDPASSRVSCLQLVTLYTRAVIQLTDITQVVRTCSAYAI